MHGGLRDEATSGGKPEAPAACKADQRTQRDRTDSGYQRDRGGGGPTGRQGESLNPLLRLDLGPSLGRLGRWRAVRRRPTMTDDDQRHQTKCQVKRLVGRSTRRATDESTCTPDSGIIPTVFRTRLALIAGSFTLISAAVVGCCAPTFLEPQPPWGDPVAQQAAWDRVLRWLVVVAGGLLLGALPLLAYGFVGWRMERRARCRERP